MIDNQSMAMLQPALSTDAQRKLIPVAISLIVVSVLWVFLCLFAIAYFYSILNAPGTNADERRTLIMYALILSISMAYSMMLVFGAFRMVRGGSYVWAVSIGFLALVPFVSPFYFAGTPIGIWALVVLFRPDVRASFQESSKRVIGSAR